MDEAEDDNPDFIECPCCGGTFYKGDLRDELCEDCHIATFGEDEDQP